MLQRLAIRDFVIVDALEIEFSSGLSVLSGETGAGKSILVDALQLELGAHLGTHGSFAHDAGVAAAAERELERVDEDRLAGAGLAAQHRQPRREIDLEGVDDDEVADRETVQHR